MFAAWFYKSAESELTHLRWVGLDTYMAESPHWVILKGKIDVLFCSIPYCKNIWEVQGSFHIDFQRSEGIIYSTR